MKDHCEAEIQSWHMTAANGAQSLPRVGLGGVKKKRSTHACVSGLAMSVMCAVYVHASRFVDMPQQDWLEYAALRQMFLSVCVCVLCLRHCTRV